MIPPLQPTTSVKHDKICKMVDANYAKTVQNTMRKNNKKVSRGNDSIVKDSLFSCCVERDGSFDPMRTINR
jgi:hypothetical protein